MPDNEIVGISDFIASNGLDPSPDGFSRDLVDWEKAAAGVMQSFAAKAGWKGERPMRYTSRAFTGHQFMVRPEGIYYTCLGKDRENGIRFDRDFLSSNPEEFGKLYHAACRDILSDGNVEAFRSFTNGGYETVYSLIFRDRSGDVQKRLLGIGSEDYEVLKSAAWMTGNGEFEIVSPEEIVLIYERYRSEMAVPVPPNGFSITVGTYYTDGEKMLDYATYPKEGSTEQLRREVLSQAAAMRSEFAKIRDEMTTAAGFRENKEMRFDTALYPSSAFRFDSVGLCFAYGSKMKFMFTAKPFEGRVVFDATRPKPDGTAVFVTRYDSLDEVISTARGFCISEDNLKKARCEVALYRSDNHLKDRKPSGPSLH